MLRKTASVLFLLTGIVIGLGAFGHDSNTAKLADEFAKFPAFDARTKAIIIAVWHFCSGCMLVFGAVLVWTWWRIRQGARDVFLAPSFIGSFYAASGVFSVMYTGVLFFWLFFVLGGLLIATTLVLAKPGSASK